MRAGLRRRAGAWLLSKPKPPFGHGPKQAEGWKLLFYRFDWPRANFLTFFLFAPRGVVRLALGAAFLRAARFSFLRSSLSSIFVVSATDNLFHVNRFGYSRSAGAQFLMVTGIPHQQKRAGHARGLFEAYNEDWTTTVQQHPQSPRPARLRP